MILSYLAADHLLSCSSRSAFEQYLNRIRKSYVEFDIEGAAKAAVHIVLVVDGEHQHDQFFNYDTSCALQLKR